MQSRFPLSKSPIEKQIDVKYRVIYFAKFNNNIININKCFIIDFDNLFYICQEKGLNYRKTYDSNEKQQEVIYSLNLTKDLRDVNKLLHKVKIDKNISKNEKKVIIPMIKDFKREYKFRRKDCFEVLPKEIRNWAWRTLGALSRDYDCVDNYRVANRGKSSQVRRYWKQKKSGCCGVYDTSMMCPIDMQEYFLGFNHGH